MRLLHSTTLKLEEFSSSEIPDYAILSHTWEKDEVSFQDIQGHMVEERGGYAKIKNCGLQADHDGYKYFWIDTCCIDKSSSAELSESINSMYRWYRNAKVCYAYLADVPADTNPWSENSAFVKSRWFTRGWTLQELIAPSRIVFYGKDWCTIGTKSSLRGKLSAITGVDTEVLAGQDPGTISIARRMSWAAERKTTIVEDIAYSLIGIFDVNMPMLYGEGERAFFRLQEEIMKNSDDHSLFAWRASPDQCLRFRGLLAESPSEFAGSRDFIPFRVSNISVPYSMTNKGLRVELGIVSRADTSLDKAFLECRVVGNSGANKVTNHVCIYLERLSLEGDQFARLLPHHLDTTQKLPTSGAKRQIVYVRQKILIPSTMEYDQYFRFHISENELRRCGYYISEIYTPHEWNPKENLLSLPSIPGGAAGALRFKNDVGNNIVLRLGLNPYSGPWYELSTKPREPLEKIHRSTPQASFFTDARPFKIDDGRQIYLAGKPGQISSGPSEPSQIPVFRVIARDWIYVEKF
jgi:hypothetical protein